MASGYNYENFKELQNDIGNAFQSGLNEKDFLPEDQLQYFVVEQVVKSVLQQQCILDEDIVRFVLDRAPRIFLIFVIMGEDKLRSLRDLKELGIDDSVLPIHISKDGNDEKYFSYSLEKETPLRQFPIANRWSRQDRDMFLLYQMQVTAPVFGQEDKFQFKFHPKRILPYLPDSGGSDKSISSGFFGEVKKRILHRSHIDKKVLNVLSELGLISTAGNGPGLAVAVKEAKDNEGLAGYPEKEAHNLHKMLLQDYKSRHLIKPIAAYEMDGRHCLIFPWAEGGNLVNYWKKYAEGPLEKENFQWILNQFVGICLGLLELHESNCRHGDLKPENILWFKEITQRGTLQLADMGLATFHDKDEDTGRRKDIQTMTPSGTSRYEPPEENDNRVKKGPRSRNYDVWSLGCTILELLVWLTSGYEELKSFRARTRKYFWKDTGTTSGRYVLDPDVEACIKAIRFNANACQAHLDLLGMVENRLLVIPVPDALKPAPGQRAGAKEVFNCIKEISSKVQNDSTYLTASALSRSTVLTKPGVVYEKDGNLAVPGHAEESRHLRPSDPTQKTDLTMKVPVQLPGQPTLRTQDTVTFGQTRHHEQVSRGFIPRRAEY